MKILHVIPYMHPSAGGPPVVVDRFCRGLQDAGHSVSVLTTDALAPTGDRDWATQYERAYEIEVLPALRRHVFGYAPQLKSALKSRLRDVDLVHVHNLWSYGNFAVSRICRKQEVPYVVSPHGMLDPHSLTRKSSKKRLYGPLIEFPRLRRASGMIYTHEKEQTLAESSCSGLPRGYVVPLGADDPPETGIREAIEELWGAFPELSGKRVVLFFGRIHPKKGLNLLIPGFAQLRRRLPDVHLVLAGPVDSSYRQQIVTETDRQGVTDSVTWTGPVFGAAKWGLLSLADVFVLPSYQENFAITVVEALRMGTPVVLSDRVNIADDIVAANAGVMTDLNAQGVADSLHKLLCDTRLHSSLAENGPQLVANRFTWTIATSFLSIAYEQSRATLGGRTGHFEVPFSVPSDPRAELPSHGSP